MQPAIVLPAIPSSRPEMLFSHIFEIKNTDQEIIPEQAKLQQPSPEYSSPNVVRTFSPEPVWLFLLSVPDDQLLEYPE